MAEPMTLFVFSDGVILLLYVPLACPKLQSNLARCNENWLMVHVVSLSEAKGGLSPKDVVQISFPILTYRGRVVLSDLRAVMPISLQS